MDKNRQNSYTSNSIHINIRCFFEKYRVDKGELKIVYYPTYLMLADYFFKLLQGKLFKKFRSVIMGYESINNILGYEKLYLKEHVEYSNKNDKILRENDADRVAT